MKTPFKLTALLIATASALTVTPLSAIKIVVPDQYKDQVEAIKEAERSERKQELQGANESTDSGLTVDLPEGEAEDNQSPEDAADEFLVQSVIEATDAATEFELNLAAGEGIISGQIIDKESGQPLSGVAILLEDTNIATVTDSEGRYSIGPAPAGEYTVSFVKTGYIEANVTDYAIVGGEVSVFPFGLPPRPADMSDEVYELQDFTVTAEEANQLMMQLDLQKLSIGQLDIMSAEEFSKFAASDIADAIKNITGVSLSDGKYAVVRGLNDRYSVTRLNGINLPSPDPDRAAVPLDVFPTGIFSGIETRKTNTPDMPGEASGGVIDLKLLKLSQERILKFSVGTGFNTNSQDDWLTTERSSSAYFFGSGADDRDFASSGDFVAGPYDVTNQDDIDEFVSVVQDPITFDTGISKLVPVRKAAPFDTKFSFLYSDIFEVSSKQSLGIVLAVDRSAKARYTKQDVNRISENTGSGADPVFGVGDYMVNSWDETRQIGTFEGKVSGLVGVTYDYDELHTIGFNFLATRTGIETSILNESGSAWGDGGQNTTTTFDEADVNNDGVVNDLDVSGNGVGLDQASGSGTAYLRTNYNQRTMFAYIFNGEHTFEDLEWLTLNWAALMAENEQLEPDTFDTRGPFGPYRISRETTQDSIGLNFSARAQLDERSTAIEVGVSRDESEREFVQKQKRSEATTRTDSTPIGTFLYYERNFIDEGIAGEATGEREIDAIYGMLDYKPTDWLQVVGGFRVETSVISYDGFGSAPQAGNYTPELVEVSPIDQRDVIPSIGVNIDLTDELVLRFAYSETIARPTYRELQPFPILNPLTNEVEVGNSGYMGQVAPGVGINPVLRDPAYRGLQIAELKNADIRLEWYPSEESFYAFGVFAKEVGNPIERIEAFGQTADLPVFTYINNENSADMFGIEIEWQQNLGRLFDAESLDWLSVGGNFTFIEASVERSAAELEYAEIEGIRTSDASDERPLYDQPDIIANLFLNARFEEIGSELTLSMNHTGDRLTSALSTSSQDIYEDAITTVNLVYSQDIPWVDGLSIKLAAKNITDPVFSRKTTKGDNDILLRDESGNLQDEISLESYRKGISYSISATYEF